MRALKLTTLLLLEAAVLAALACAVHRQQDTRIGVKVPTECILAVGTEKQTRCAGPDMWHLTCTGLTLKLRKGCEVVEVQHGKP